MRDVIFVYQGALGWTVRKLIALNYAEHGVEYVGGDCLAQYVSLEAATNIANEYIEERPDSPECGICGKPAVCFGSYDGNQDYACDECCGHGCEDGSCYPLVVEE